ncbi:MAG: long-chain fatty acid--CoA ligase [Muribaculum sp.]|nr:long-chain fatty acid--CoA ligase [Muribaculum sp.]
MANKLVEMIRRQAEKYVDREAYRYCWRKAGEWLPTSWEEFRTQIDVAARALARLGVKEKDTIAICSNNTPQILISEFAGFRNRVASIPLYSSSSQSQYDFIVNNGQARILFVGEKHQYPLAYNYWKSHTGQIDKIIIFKTDGIKFEEDDTVSISWDEFLKIGLEADEDTRILVEQRSGRGLPDDIATLIYTSGTTGEPKGVCISHSNYDAAMEAHLKFLTNVNDKQLSMSFLPMSHIFEKAWCYFCLTKGIRIAVNEDPRIIQDTIREVRPNLMTCVPRFWEKVYAGVKEKIANMSKMQQIMVGRAIRVGYRRNLGFRREGKPVPMLLEKEYRFWDKRVFSLVKNTIGIPNPVMFPTAGAALSPRITEFMQSIGINVIIGYGLSETTATVSAFPFVDYEIGTVGKPLPMVKVKIDENGEILVKGPTVTSGYYENPEANAEAFTDDGWFRTGDAGYFTENGSLVLTERVKDLFKTSNGKYIAPQLLESRLAENKFIDEVAVIGDKRKYVTALVVPNLEQLQAWGILNHIDSSDIRTFLKDERVINMVMTEIDELQKDLAKYEQIKKITLLPNHFSLAHGEVTNTMKVRRPVVAERYAREIEAMYDGAPVDAPIDLPDK